MESANTSLHEKIRIFSKRSLIDEKTTKRFFILAQKYFKLKKRIGKLEEEIKKTKDKIVEISKIYGIKKIESEDFILTIFPKEKIEWNIEELKKILKGFYPLVVREKKIIKITIPGEKIALAQEIKKVLEKKIPKEWFAEETIVEIEKKKLKEIAEKHLINIVDAQKKEIIWAIKVLEK